MNAELFIPAPPNRQGKPNWINTNDRDHWATRSRKTKAWRNITHWVAKAERLPQGLDHATIIGYVHKTNGAAYDAHNLMPTLKAIMDGLVDYGLIPDDQNKHLTGPDIRPGQRRDKAGISLAITAT